MVNVLCRSSQGRRIHCRLWLLGVLFLSLAGAHAASTIAGRVTDPEGAGIAGAEVIAVQPEGDFSHAVLTAEDGSYALELTSPGVYIITVRKPGYQELVQESIVSEPGNQASQLDLRLRPSTAQAEVRGVEELNPNVFVVKLDTNEISRELMRRGGDTQFIREFHAQENYFGAVHGFPLKRVVEITPRPLLGRFHGSVYESHQNSALNARSFFTVGELLPSRRNEYGATVGGPIAREKASFNFAWSQIRETGYVNGNIQAPLAEERAPLSSDPATNAVIAGLLQAFPEEVPNLPHVSLRQLNTNALRSIRSTAFSSRLDFRPGEADHLALEQRFLDSTEVPFQIVIGQNPDTFLRPQSVHLSHTHTFSPNALGRLSYHFDRLSVTLDVPQGYRDLLTPLGIQVVPEIEFGGDFTGLGPGDQFPRMRVENRFYAAPEITLVRGRHTLAAGVQLARLQVNDLQSDNSRGKFNFARNFGRTSAENFLLGRPTSFTITLGNLYRGFRNWENAFYFHDIIRASPRWTFSLGLRYEVMTAPAEVNGLTEIPYQTDANNLSPQFGFAWNPGGGKTVVRGGYTVAFGSIFPVLYQRARFNPPAVSVISVDNPDLLDPLRGIDLRAAARPRSALNLLSPDMVAPYSHLYNFGIERNLSEDLQVRLGYVGSRSMKLPTRYGFNRARPVPGIPLTTATINQRRPDPRYLEINSFATGSIGYYDGLQVAVEQRPRQGLSWNARYTFSKALSTGDAPFNSTGGNNHVSNVEDDAVGDMKGPERFDTPHSLVLGYRFELPWFRGQQGRKSLFLGGWSVSGTTMFRSGTPTHLHTGSDSPGFGNVDGSYGDRPNLLNPAILGASVDHPDRAPLIYIGQPAPGEISEYFDTNLPPGGRGNIGWQTFRNDGVHNWNLAVEKQFPIREAMDVQFRTELINAFNQPQFDEVQHGMASETFAKIVNTANRGRIIQLRLRLQW